MPRSKKKPLEPSAVVAWRAAVEAAAHRRGLEDHAALARLLDCSPATVGVNLGQPGYQTRRDPTLQFALLVEQRLGVPPLVGVVAPAGATSAPSSSDDLPPGIEEVVSEFLARTGAANSPQLTRLMQASASQGNRVLARLAERGVVERVREAPVSGSTHAMPFIYGLSRKSLGLMEKTLGNSLHGAFSHGELKMGALWRHNRVVSDIAVALNLEFAAALGDWCTDSDARGPIEIPAGRKRAVEPDLLAHLTFDGVPRVWWFEVDLASEPQTEIVRKARACDSYFHSKNFAERWNVERLRVLWVATSEERARKLREWIGPTRPTLMHHFAPLSAVRREGLGGAIWLALNGRDERTALVAATGVAPAGK